MPRDFFVYMLASRRNGTLYVGMTNHLARRIFEHKTGAVPGFTREHKVTRLVWYEQAPSIDMAKRRERSLKRWRRRWKLELIEALNPDWRDLYEDLI